jgi:hypothetical protein
MIVNFTGQNQTVKPQLKPLAKPNFTASLPQKVDTVSFGAKEAKEAAGEKLQVFKSLAQGVWRPIETIGKAIIENPVPTGLVIAAAVATITFLPIVGTALALGVCGFGAYKIGSSTIQAVKAYKQGDNHKANNEIKDVGEGVFEVGLTVVPAIKGVKELRGTVNAINEASKAAATEQKALNFVQKLYAVIKQVQSKSAVTKAPRTYQTLFERIKNDGISEFALLKNGPKIKRGSKELEKVISQVQDPARKSQLMNILEELAKTSDKAKSSQMMQTISELLKAEKITTTDIGKLVEIVENVKEQPAIIAVLKQAMKAGQGSVDDAARAINKALGAGRLSDDAARTIAAVENSESR